MTVQNIQGVSEYVLQTYRPCKKFKDKSSEIIFEIQGAKKVLS